MGFGRAKQLLRRHLPQPVFEWLLALKNGGQRLPAWPLYERYLAGGRGIEIGGPSLAFKSLAPAYRVLQSVDGANFADQTLWESTLQVGPHFRYLAHRRGWQHICEATRLDTVGTGHYDAVLSCNCLEHLANPLAALHEWQRVLRPGGVLVLVLPNPASNFDHRRPVTTLEHLRDDFAAQRGEDDFTHLDEILQLHDLSRDAPAGTFEQFRARCLDNVRYRALHHHVFDAALMRAMLEEAGFTVLDVSTTPKDFYALAQRGATQPSEVPHA